MRKYKEIKRKEVIYELEEWELIKKWAARFNITTSEYIRQSSLTDKITVSKIPGRMGGADKCDEEDRREHQPAHQKSV